MRTCVLVCASAFALCANAAESGWFGFSLDGYANGQALGPGVGGEWQAASVVATNVFDGVRNGIAISPDMEEEIAFAPVAPPNGRDVERIDRDAVVAYEADLHERGYAVTSIDRHISAVKSFQKSFVVVARSGSTS